MKKTLFLFTASATLFSCSETTERSTTDVVVTENQAPVTQESNQEPAASSIAENDFDVNSVPVSTAEIGVFPFFNAPKGTMYINNPKVQEYNEIYFPVKGNFQLKKGKTFMTHVHKDPKSDAQFSAPFFLKSYEDIILAAGGVKINEQKIAKEQTDYLQENATYLGQNGSIDYWNNPVRTYVIRRTDGDVYVQLSANSASGSLQMVQEKPLEQTITFVKADEIAQELANSGKAVLYINFDHDKATLKTDGKTAVAEIANALKADPDLKLSIEGHTDNAGNAAHNKNLSENRAKTVMTELTTAGIAENRLKTVGFGAEKPLVTNDSDANKARNRRVELVKI